MIRFALGSRVARVCSKITPYHSRRLATATVCRTAVTAAALLGLAPCATANAASPLRVQRAAYRILLSTFKGELAVTEGQVQHGSAMAKQQLAPCLAAIKGYSVPQGAAQVLQGELGDQYIGIALHRVLELAMTQDTRTEQLPIGPKLKAALHTEVAQGAGLFELNTCAAFAAWKAAGFAPSSEPSGTQLAIAFDNTPSAGTEGALYRMLSPSQRRTINPIKKKGDAHLQALVGAVGDDLLLWLA